MSVCQKHGIFSCNDPSCHTAIGNLLQGGWMDSTQVITLIADRDALRAKLQIAVEALEKIVKAVTGDSKAEIAQEALKRIEEGKNR